MPTDLKALDRARYQQAVRDLSNPAFWRQWRRERELAALRAIQESRSHDDDR